MAAEAEAHEGFCELYENEPVPVRSMRAPAAPDATATLKVPEALKDVRFSTAPERATAMPLAAPPTEPAPKNESRHGGMAVPGKGRLARVALKAAESSVAGPSVSPATEKDANQASPLAAPAPHVLKATEPAPEAVREAPRSTVNVAETWSDEQFATESNVAEPVAAIASGLASVASCANEAEKAKEGVAEVALPAPTRDTTVVPPNTALPFTATLQREAVAARLAVAVSAVTCASPRAMVSSDTDASHEPPPQEE
jgi:hypothetical protein